MEAKKVVLKQKLYPDLCPYAWYSLGAADNDTAPGGGRGQTATKLTVWRKIRNMN